MVGPPPTTACWSICAAAELTVLGRHALTEFDNDADPPGIVLAEARNHPELLDAAVCSRNPAGGRTGYHERPPVTA